MKRKANSTWTPGNVTRSSLSSVDDLSVYPCLCGFFSHPLVRLHLEVDLSVADEARTEPVEADLDYLAAKRDEDDPVIYVVHNWTALPLTAAD